MMVGALTDPFDDCHMGVTAENVAAEVAAHARGAGRARGGEPSARREAIDKGHLQEQILPIEVKGKKGTVLFDTDEHVRADATVERLAKLKPVFDENGTVTAGNASGINDAAAAVVLMERAGRGTARPEAAGAGSSPTATPASIPKFMGIGPVPAVQARAREGAARASATSTCSRSNEAFAAQALAVVRDLELPADRTNPNGSGDLARPSDRRDRLHPDGQGALRAASAPAAATGSSRCASAAGRASRPSSSGCETGRARR